VKKLLPLLNSVSAVLFSIIRSDNPFACLLYRLLGLIIENVDTNVVTLVLFGLIKQVF